jgi:hypothetical protein
MRICCFVPGKDKRIFLSSFVFSATVQHYQPSVQWIPVPLSPRLSGGGVMLTTHLHPMLKLRMSGAIPPFTHMPSWYALGKPYLR